MADEIEIGSIKLPRGEELVFRVSEYRNEYFFSIRVFWEDPEGVRRPTRKGIHLHGGLFKDFLTNVEKIGRTLSTKRSDKEEPAAGEEA